MALAAHARLQLWAATASSEPFVGHLLTTEAGDKAWNWHQAAILCPRRSEQTSGMEALLDLADHISSSGL